MIRGLDPTPATAALIAHAMGNGLTELAAVEAVFSARALPRPPRGRPWHRRLVPSNAGGGAGHRVVDARKRSEKRAA